MSNSGQAPNVSMDELLSSIKNMIEGESNGGAGSIEPGGVDPHAPVAQAPVDEGIMDLTKVVEAPTVAPDQVNPEFVNNAPQQTDHVNNAPAEQAVQETVSELNNILDGMSDDFGVSNAQLAGLSPDLQQPVSPPVDTQSPMQQESPQHPPLQQDPVFEGQMPGDISHPDPALSRGLDPVQDDLQGQAPQEGISPQGGIPDAMPQEAMQNEAMQHEAMQHEVMQQGIPPYGGQDPQDPQGQFANNNPQQGQPPQDQMGQANQIRQGQQLGQQSGMPPMGQPQGQPVHQEPSYQEQPFQGQQAQMGVMPPPLATPPAAGHDPRLESEFAMGQALSQADASLNTTPGLQAQNLQDPNFQGQNFQGHPPQGQLPQEQAYQAQQHQDQQAQGYAGAPTRGLQPQGGQGQLPVPAARRDMVPAGAPMMGLADPSVEQLPAEMRNNLEEIVKQLLKPLLREWLERNLPELLRGAVDEQGKIDPDRL